MNQRLPAGLALFVASSLAGAQTLTIDHQPVACAVAERFPRLQARFNPEESVALARVVFQGANPQEWYSVAMKPEGDAYTGVLPRPKSSLKAFTYYIEVTGKALGTNRTPDITTAVVDSSSTCKGKITAGALGSATVMLHGPAGVVAVPAGFAASGVTVVGAAAGASTGAAGATVGSGGGLSGGALAGIVVGGAAAVTGVAVAAGGGGSGSPTRSASPPSLPSATPTPTPPPTATPAPTPAPTPTPTSCPACYAGQWRLQGTFTSIANPSLCGNKPGDVGKVETLFPVTFNADGSIVFPPGGGGRGSVDASGNFRLDFDGDPPGSGLTCPAGGATGRCTSVNSCTGSGSQGGDTIAIQIDRQ